MPPNTTLTSRTASRGSCPCASCACVISLRPNPSGRVDPAKPFAGRDDEGYLIPSTTRATFPPAFNFLLSSFFECGAVAAQRRLDVPYHRHETRSNIVAQPIFREAECGRAAIERIRTGSVIQLQGDADRMDVVVPLAGRDRKAVLGHGFAGAFDAVAHLGPAAAVMLAQFAQQGGALVGRQRPDIGPAHRGGCNRDPRTDVQLNAERHAAALAEIDHAGAVAAADRDRAAGLAHHFLAKRFGQMPNAEIGKRGIAERHGRRRQLILLEPRNRCKVAELGQGVGQPRNGWLRQVGAGRDLLIAEKPVVGTECAQHIKAAGKRDDEAAIGRHLLGWTFHGLLLRGPR